MSKEINHPVLCFVAKISDMPVDDINSMWEKFIKKAHNDNLDIEEIEKIFFRARKKATGKNKGIMDLLFAGYIGYWFGIDVHTYAMEREEARWREPTELVTYYAPDGTIQG